MQSVFVTNTKLIASKNYFCKEFFCNIIGRDGRGGGSVCNLILDDLLCCQWESVSE